MSGQIVFNQSVSVVSNTSEHLYHETAMQPQHTFIFILFKMLTFSSTGGYCLLKFVISRLKSVIDLNDYRCSVCLGSRCLKNFC